MPDLLDECKMAREKSTEALTKLRKYFANIPLLIIDEWLLFKIDETDCQNLLQIIDRKSARRSTIVISQFNSDEWISQMPIQVAAEAITDRLTSQAFEIILHSKESMRNQSYNHVALKTKNLCTLERLQECRIITRRFDMESNYFQALRAVFSGISQRKVAKLHRLSRNTIAVLVCYAHQQGWTKLEDLTHVSSEELTSALSQEGVLGGKRDQSYTLPDYEYVHQELGKENVTLTMLWEEYVEKCLQDGARYYKETQFRRYHHQFAKSTPDNLKTGVLKPNFYEPSINRSYQEMAEYYGTVIPPARIRKPQDKAAVENSVKIASQRILGKLWNHPFHSFFELQEAVAKTLEKINSAPLTGKNMSRWDAFLAEEKTTCSRFLHRILSCPDCRRRAV